MAIINYAAREMTAKIVYYGPGLSGKTTSIQCIHNKISPANKGKLVSLATETDRTLFFDFFPVDFGQIGGFKVKFNFYTVPGQVFYNTTRKLVLKGADGVVFVSDSQEGMREQNQESLENLFENLRIHGLDPETIPFVIQYNKRDIPGAMPLELMRRELNKRNVPDFETNAVTGEGIMEAMKNVCKMVLEDLRRKQKTPTSSAANRPVAPRPAPAPLADAVPVAAAQAAPATPPAPAAPAQVSAPAAPARQAPSAPVVEAAQPEATVERTTVLPVAGPGTISTGVSVPLTLTVSEGVEGVRINVRVEVSYLTRGAGQVEVGQAAPLASGSGPVQVATEESPRKKGLFSRLFGGG